MDVDQHGLFELPVHAPTAPPERPQRGRNREVWALTATAEVTITDAAALHSASRTNEGFALSVSGADPSLDDAESKARDARPGDDVFDALAWLIWPTDGLEEALDAGAMRILSVESEAVAESADHRTATWRVTAKLTDVDVLRRLASFACPNEAAEISESLVVAWQRAADPFAPLRSIAGISWEPGRVVVEHVPARAARNR